MRYISTSSASPSVSFEEAVSHCLSADGGMFMPEYIPRFPQAFFNNISEMSLRDIAFVVASAFIGDAIDSPSLKRIVDQSFAFEAPLRHLFDDVYALELFHGPTLTFKDFGARFMARILRHFDSRRCNSRRNVLVATTGNTGAATANGLLNLEGISVSVLYPKGHLSRAQTKQLTALGGNIHPVEVMGTVEDCKRLVRDAIADPLLGSLNLTGANSINIARLIPQITFVLHAYARLREQEVANAEKASYSMPTGNMSNLVAAVIAQRCGAPIGRLIAATAVNNCLGDLINGASPESIGPEMRVKHTLVPAIDMVLPSGWPRLQSLYRGDLAAMRRDITVAPAASDTEIAATINELRARAAYTIDPHGAVALRAAMTCGTDGAPKVVFATGHPAKQLDIMTRITGCAIELPVQLTRFMALKRSPAMLPPTLPAFKKYLLSIHNKQ